MATRPLQAAAPPPPMPSLHTVPPRQPDGAAREAGTGGDVPNAPVIPNGCSNDCRAEGGVPDSREEGAGGGRERASSSRRHDWHAQRSARKVVKELSSSFVTSIPSTKVLRSAAAEFTSASCTSTVSALAAIVWLIVASSDCRRSAAAEFKFFAKDCISTVVACAVIVWLIVASSASTCSEETLSALSFASSTCIGTNEFASSFVKSIPSIAVKRSAAAEFTLSN